MLIEAEVITHCNQRTVTEHLAIGSEHHLQASTKIQVFVARSTNKRMPPNGISIIPESPHMIVYKACPRIFARINTDPSMNGSCYINRNIIA